MNDIINAVSMIHRRKAIAPPNASKFYAAAGRRQRAPPEPYAVYVPDVLSPSSSLGTAVEVCGSCLGELGGTPATCLQAVSDDDMPLAQLLQVQVPGSVTRAQDLDADSQGSRGEVEASLLADRCVALKLLCINYKCIVLKITVSVHKSDCIVQALLHAEAGAKYDGCVN